MEEEGSVIYFLPIAQPVKCLVMSCTIVLSDGTTRSESYEDLYTSQYISSGMAWNVRKGPKYSFSSLCHNIKPPLSQTIPLIQFVTGALSNE
jgi:hypothetical protein